MYLKEARILQVKWKLKNRILFVNWGWKKPGIYLFTYFIFFSLQLLQLQILFYKILNCLEKFVPRSRH